jgi:murein tripeptide amidase MpaA
MTRLAAAALAAAATTLASAQLPMDAPLATGTTYNRAIPTPEMALGFRTGTRYARSHEITEYYRLIAEKSPRVRIGSFGRSWEGRDLTYAIVSTPENLLRLDEIREANRQLVFEADKVTDEAANEMPIIVWSGYGVHGNEASGPDAALLVLYHLAAGGREVDEMLRNMVIILGPNYNPDGRERFVGRANAFRGVIPSADPADLEHTETWPAGRTNHYYFDLNRDWMPLTQPESSLRHAEYVRWRPQVTLDFHEMGGTSYFFQPGEPNRVNPLTPRSNQEWTRRFAAYHARALESVGERYFIERRYDDFYPGKGSTYPDLVGSIGILFEQSGVRGMVTDRGSHLQTYVSTVRNQVACSLSSFQAAHENRVSLIRHQRDQFRGPRRSGGWMLSDSLEGMRLARILRKHEIEVYRWGRQLFVPADQPLHLLAEAMLTPPDRFEDNQFYDISTWGLGHAFRAHVEPLDIEPARPASRTFLIEDDAEPRGGFRAAERPLGYLLYRTYGQFYGAVSDLQAAGRRVHFVTKKVGPASPGEVFIPVGDAASDNALMERIARERGVVIHGVEGQTGEIANWGGSELTEISPRRIGLIAESGADLNLLGEIWWRMDAHHRIPVTLTASGTDLTRFDTVIFCGSSSTGIADRLAAFVEQGGTLVAVGAGANAVAASPVWQIESATYRPDTSALPYGDVAAETGRHEVPGTILAVLYDETHPLTFGARPGVAFREGSTFLVPPNTAAQVVGRYGAEPVVAGYLSPEVSKLAAGKASVLARRSGRGRVVLFADAPAFRGFFTAQEDLFLNAVFFSQAF